MEEIDRNLRRAVKNYRNAMVETAYEIRRLSERGEWTRLGFAGADEYRDSLGLSESLWETHLLLGERLSSLTLDQMREISISTARLLTSINAKIWDEFAWVEEARMLRPKEFAALVARRNRDLAEQGRVGNGAEPRAALTVAVPVSQQERLESQIELLRRSRKLRSLSDALELALAAAEREPIWASQVQKLVQAVEELDRVWEGMPMESEEEQSRRLVEGETHSISSAALQTQKITRRMLLVLNDLIQAPGQAGERPGRAKPDAELSNTVAGNTSQP